MQLSLIDDPALIAAIGQSTGPRTRDVLHLSQITKALSKSLEPDRFSDDKGPNVEKMEAGLSFELILEEGLQKRFGVIRVGELVSPEGIWMSPDGYNPTTNRLEEYKATWMSSRPEKGSKFPAVLDRDGLPHRKFRHWFWQIMGYCKALDLTGATLRTFYVCGNYDRPFQPELIEYALDFTQEEIDENWSMLVNYAKELGWL